MKTPVAMQRCAVDGAEDVGPALVLLHGWGSDSRIWQPLLPLLANHFVIHCLDLPGVATSHFGEGWQGGQDVVDSLAALMPARAHLLGWSLGGNLALEYAARYPTRVMSLNLVATNPVFVQRPGWPCAMEADSFDQFYRRVKADPETGLRRFRQLQARGDKQAKSVLRLLASMYDRGFAIEPQALLEALSWLQSCDQRALLGTLEHAPRFLLGECDELVPVTLADHLSRVTVLPGCGHIPMLSEPESLARWMLQVLPGSGQVDAGQAQTAALRDSRQEKQRIARSFSQAAASYDKAADLQRAVGNALAKLIPASEPGLALDLGCGTGYFLRRVQSSRNDLTWLGGDLAEGMLNYCQSTQPTLAGRLLGLDAEALPFADDALRGIYSSLALQWCQDLDLLFAELRRVIMPGGWVAFSTLVDGTLHELKSSWQQVDGYVHVNHFFSESDWCTAAEKNGLRGLHWQRQTRVAHYLQLRDLMHELKALGAHNVNTGMASGLTGKRSWHALSRAYEDYRGDHGRLPASWQVLYGVLSLG